MIAGARSFLQELAERGVSLYLASGTDQVYVQREAEMLGVTEFFKEGVYGAKGDSEEDSKEKVIQRILAEHHLAGAELLVTGDGPVEIQLRAAGGAVALGLAADEERGSGFERAQEAAAAGSRGGFHRDGFYAGQGAGGVAVRVGRT